MNDELQVGEVLSADGREYTITQFLGRGGSYTAYLAECKYDGFITKCILKQSRSDEPAFSDEVLLNAQPHYLLTAQTQHNIRRIAHLTNQTPPVNNTFEVNGKGFIEVPMRRSVTIRTAKKYTIRFPRSFRRCLMQVL